MSLPSKSDGEGGSARVVRGVVAVVVVAGWVIVVVVVACGR